VTQYTTFITIGNMPNALRDYLADKFGLSADQVQSVLDTEPYGGFKSSEERYQWIRRTDTKLKGLRSALAA
jgi:hypothetical protein